MDGPDGTVTHAELDFGAGRLQLGDPQDAYQLAAPGPGCIRHRVDRAVLRRCRRRGGTCGGCGRHRPGTLQTFVTGDRFASLIDPFGRRWTVMTRVEDLTPPEEQDRRLAEWASTNT